MLIALQVARALITHWLEGAKVTTAGLNRGSIQFDENARQYLVDHIVNKKNVKCLHQSKGVVQKCLTQLNIRPILKPT